MHVLNFSLHIIYKNRKNLFIELHKSTLKNYYENLLNFSLLATNVIKFEYQALKSFGAHKLNIKVLRIRSIQFFNSKKYYKVHIISKL